MGIIETVNEIIEMMVPPPTADHRKQHMYRVRLTLVACSAFMGLVFWIAVSLGDVPIVFGGFARADDLRSFHVSQLDKDIMDFRKDGCRATSSLTKELYMQRIQWLAQEYQRLTGYAYTLPGCSDITGSE